MSNKVKIAIDAMSGENAPKKIIDGINISLRSNQENFFYLYGQEDLLKKEVSKSKLLVQNCEIINTRDIILDDESPLAAAKRGKESSMWKAVESLKEKNSHISLSAGNTGALLVISRLLLTTINGINKPALAALWPNKNGMNVVLDLGANIECDEKNLIDFACMGSSLFKSLFVNDRPKIALLNIGLEENKGNDVLKKTFSILKNKNLKSFEFLGYIEGNHIMDGGVDVIITDGFTGNIALKTAEGTANMIQNYLKLGFKSSIISKLGYLLSSLALKTVNERLDPRIHNCGILIGLNSPVIKCHGSSEHVGISYAADIIYSLLQNKVNERIKEYISHSMKNR